LDSLGINTLQKNGLGNHKEASDLTEAVKQTLYEEYLQAYSESNRVKLVPDKANYVSGRVFSCQQ
jgi:hypothetical protein